MTITTYWSIGWSAAEQTMTIKKNLKPLNITTSRQTTEIKETNGLNKHKMFYSSSQCLSTVLCPSSSLFLVSLNGIKAGGRTVLKKITAMTDQVNEAEDSAFSLTQVMKSHITCSVRFFNICPLK